MLLDDLVPRYDVYSRHAIWVNASPAVVYEAARHVDLGRPWVVRLLMGVRLMPAWLATGPRWARNRVGAQRPGGAAAFTLIAESPGEEFVLGIWAASGRQRAVVTATAERFRDLPPSGLAQAVWNFRVRSRGVGTELSTETRVRCGDEVTRPTIGRYWRIIRLGSGLIRTACYGIYGRWAERARQLPRVLPTGPVFKRPQLGGAKLSRTADAPGPRRAPRLAHRARTTRGPDERRIADPVEQIIVPAGQIFVARRNPAFDTVAPGYEDLTPRYDDLLDGVGKLPLVRGLE